MVQVKFKETYFSIRAGGDEPKRLGILVDIEIEEEQRACDIGLFPKVVKAVKEEDNARIRTSDLPLTRCNGIAHRYREGSRT